MIVADEHEGRPVIWMGITEAAGCGCLVFGFEAAAQSPPGAVVLKTAPIPLALREPLRPLPEAGPLGVGMVLWIACDDANALHDLIVKRGGAILSPLADGPFGRFFVAGDPDGYAITFHTARS